jgi:superoxide dismutase, Cu-Zn family
MFTSTRTQAVGVGAALVLCAAAAATAATGTTATGHVHHSGSDDDQSEVRVVLRGVDGTKFGRVTMWEDDGVVLVRGRAEGLTPGFHGFHVHAVGLCEPAAPLGPFTTAGGHYTGGDTQHGDHAGDMPSLLVMADGRARMQFGTDRFQLADLDDADGSAVMVHAGRDNYANIPTRYSAAGVPVPDATTLATGDAGARVACGVID